MSSIGLALKYNDSVPVPGSFFLTKEIIKGDKAREEQILEAEKSKLKEKQKIKKALQKTAVKEKKVPGSVEKKTVKKKPLTTKKK